MPEPSIFISAGEASGEHYGALLVWALKKRLEDQNRRAAFFGMGGQRMADAGVERIVRAEDVAVMGITEVLRHLPRIYREFRRLKRAVGRHPPSIAVLIDFPDIHLKLAQEFKRLGVPVVYFVSPQLWAWKKHRIKLVRRYVDRMLVIFPFEESFYRERGVKAEFVGHPLGDLPPPTIGREELAQRTDLDPARTWIALLPGSRAKEIRSNLPEILAGARMLAERGAYEFVIPLAPTLEPEHRGMVARLVEEHGSGLTVRLVDDARDALFHSRGSVVASGTATVEAALIGNPFVVVYRVSPLTYAIAKRVVTVPHVAMANLIAGRRVVPELIQNEFTAAKIVEHLGPLLPDGPLRESMKQELRRIATLLKTGNDGAGTKGPGHQESNEAGNEETREQKSSEPGTGTDRPRGAIDRAAAVTLELLGIASPVVDSVPL